MIVVFKLIHFAALMMGGAALIGNGLIMRRMATEKGPPPPMVGGLLGTFGLVGFSAIILLWLSGLGLVWQLHGSFALGPWFALKLVGASVVLLGSVTLRVIAARAQREGRPPPASVMKNMTMVLRLALATALFGAVMAFN
jgi:hypothetical protein